MAKKNVEQRLKIHLLKGKTVTTLQGWDWWRSYRLPVYVNRLRKKGYVVKTEMIRKGETSYAKYHL